MVRPAETLNNFHDINIGCHIYINDVNNLTLMLTYDLEGNILTLERKGPKRSNYYGIIDDIKATYQGNQIATLRDDAPSVLLETSLDLPNGSWSGNDFGYDRNGNQTRDLSRGVADIAYNELNLPEHVEMDGGGSIEYLYTAAGTKLAEIVCDEDDRIINRRDYVGAFEYEADSIVRFSLDSGYLTVTDTVYHLYTPDYQGNIVAVYDTRSGSQEHYKEFYPYGLPHAPMPESSSITPVFPSFPGLNPGLGSGLGPIIKPSDSEPEPSSTNRRWYGAKELTTDHGLNAYDFEARWLAPAFPRFTTPDPLAERTQSVGIYVFCSGDPINLIDPTGLYFVFAPNTSDEFKESFYQACEILRQFDASENLDALEKSKKAITVQEGNINGPNKNRFNPKSKTIYWMPDQGLVTDTNYLLCPVETLQHEFDHGARSLTDYKRQQLDGKTPDKNYGNLEEKRVVKGSERDTALKMGRIGKDQETRITYGSAHFESVSSLTATKNESDLQINVYGQAPPPSPIKHLIIPSINIPQKRIF